MCIGTSAGAYEQTTPELEDKHLDGISFADASYLMPWALYTVAPGTIANGSTSGELTEAGRRLVNCLGVKPRGFRVDSRSNC